MSAAEPLKRLGKQSFREYHQDGILDILVGFSMLGFALWLELDIALFAFACWLSVGLYKTLKKALTIPRFGFVRFEEDQKQFLIGISAAVIVTLLLLAARFLILERTDNHLALAAFLRKNHPYIMSSIGALLLIGFGVWRGLTRFAVYGLAFLALIWAFFLAEIPGQMALFGAGSVLLLVGLIMLVTFLQTHPILSLKGEQGE